ncbi:unnamed protein product [Zymoseptoria tritici ST99CH_3D7]|uniref:Uncharacterized protein n=1 Tax=Zymoseptoria tritici (strain ST99CH_3D7) TaxID=1276538 RepID=A0A1X7S2B7_ZYMT9|nr:unnamed protein product [Zymoseptoria tritici ST99CH_3D7]
MHGDPTSSGQELTPAASTVDQVNEALAPAQLEAIPTSLSSAKLGTINVPSTYIPPHRRERVPRPVVSDVTKALEVLTPPPREQNPSASHDQRFERSRLRRPICFRQSRPTSSPHHIQPPVVAAEAAIELGLAKLGAPLTPMPDIWDATKTAANPPTRSVDYQQNIVIPSKGGLLTLLASTRPKIFGKIVALLPKEDRQAAQHANMTVMEAISEAVGDVLPGKKSGRPAITRKLASYGKDLSERLVKSYNHAFDSPHRAVVTVNGFSYMSTEELALALYVGSHASSENTKRAPVYRLEVTNGSGFDLRAVRQLKERQFPHLRAVEICQCPDFSVHTILTDDFDSSDDDSNNGSEDECTDEADAPTIWKKLDALQHSVDFDLCEPQPKHAAHMGVDSHAYILWHEATPYSIAATIIWYKPDRVLESPKLLRQLFSFLNKRDRAYRTDPMDPETLRNRKPRPHLERLSFEDLKLLLADLIKGDTTGDRAMNFRRLIAICMHHGGDDTKLPRHGAKLVKEQLMEDVRCPGCGKWAPSGCYTPPALRDARRHEGLGCVGCRGKKATEEYADTVRVHLNEADEAGKPEIHEWQEWNEDYTAPLHERVVERDADLNPVHHNEELMEARPSPLLCQPHHNHSLVPPMMPAGSRDQIITTLQRSAL